MGVFRGKWTYYVLFSWFREGKAMNELTTSQCVVRGVYMKGLLLHPLIIAPAITLRFYRRLNLVGVCSRGDLWLSIIRVNLYSNTNDIDDIIIPFRKLIFC